MDPRRCIDPAKAQYSDERFETAEGDSCGVRFETVQFPGVTSLEQVYDAAVYHLTNGKFGMVVLDSIDEDELYPYKSGERVRKDVSATAVFTVGNDEQGNLVITMRRAAFLKMHRPQFPLSEDALQELATGIMAWGDVMLKTVRSIV